MAFAPIVPTGGLAGFRFLERTFERQLESFSRGPELSRDIAHFLEQAGQVETVDDLLADRRLTRVVLGAFGLEDDLGKTALLRRIISDGSIDPGAFANRLAEPAYREMAAALGFGDLGNRLILGSVREEIAERYRVRSFERAVGEQSVDMRLALTFRREAARIATSETADRSGWLRIIGSRPLRQVIETAFGLPQQFGLIDIDQQRAELESIARRRYGVESATVFRDTEVREDVIRRFLAISQARAGLAGGPGATPSAQPATSSALELLRAGGLGPGAQAGLFASNLR